MALPRRRARANISAAWIAACANQRSTHQPASPDPRAPTPRLAPWRGLHRNATFQRRPPCIRPRSDGRRRGSRTTAHSWPTGLPNRGGDHNKAQGIALQERVMYIYIRFNVAPIYPQPVGVSGVEPTAEVLQQSCCNAASTRPALERTSRARRLRPAEGWLDRADRDGPWPQSCSQLRPSGIR